VVTSVDSQAGHEAPKAALCSHQRRAIVTALARRVLVHPQPAAWAKAQPAKARSTRKDELRLGPCTPALQIPGATSAEQSPQLWPGGFWFTPNPQPGQRRSLQRPAALEKTSSDSAPAPQLCKSRERPRLQPTVAGATPAYSLNPGSDPALQQTVAGATPALQRASSRARPLPYSVPVAGATPALQRALHLQWRQP
jgi:hypothetical protein